MANDKESETPDREWKSGGRGMGWKGGGYGMGGMGGGIYGLGFIGAAVYYFTAAPTFWLGIVGIIKAFFWPAFLVYKLLGM